MNERELMAIDLAALRSELAADPAGLGYAPLVHVAADDAVAALMNDPAKGGPVRRAIPMLRVLTWGAKTGVRAGIEVAANDPASPVHAVALTVRDMFWGGTVGATLDITDADVAGATVGGVYQPGLIDALVATAIMTADQKDSLFALGTTPGSRAEVLFGPGEVVTPTHVAGAR